MNARKLHALIRSRQIQYLTWAQVRWLLGTLKYTLLVLLVLMCVGYSLNRYIHTRALPWYRRRYTNLLPLKTSYTRWLAHAQFTVLPNLWTLASVLGWFVSSIQYFLLGRRVNFIVSVLNLLLNGVLTEISFYHDKQSLNAGQRRLRITRAGKHYRTAVCQLRVGDVFRVEQLEAIPVSRACLLSHTPRVFNVQASNGESDTYQTVQPLAHLQGGWICLSSQGCSIRVEQTYAVRRHPQTADTLTTTIIATQTLCTVLLGALLFLLLQVGKMGTSIEMNHLSLLSVLCDLISALVLFNFLLPHMKTLPTTLLRTVALQWYAQRQHVRWVSSDVMERIHQPYADTECWPGPVVVVSDKTGSLTCNALRVEHMVCASGVEDPHRYVVAMNSAFLGAPGQTRLYANSPEEREIASYMTAQGYVRAFSNCPVEYDTWQVRTIELRRHFPMEVHVYAKEYQTGLGGRHALWRDKECTYAIVQFQSEQLAQVIDSDEVWIPQRPSRSLMIAGYRFPSATVTITDFEQEWIPHYVHALRNKHRINRLYRVAEFYFDDPLRPHTLDAYRLLTEQPNVSFVMCTGDSLTTAQYIAEQLGMHEFALHDHLHPDALHTHIVGQHAVYAKFSAQDKARLIDSLQLQLPDALIVMYGDQKNDEAALTKCDYGFVQTEGAIDCQIASKCRVDNLMGVYAYLFRFRRLRLQGQYWLMNQFHLFNCMLTAISLVGLHATGFPQREFLYLDPWNPWLSLILTNVIALLLIWTSVFGRRVQMDLRQIQRWRPLLYQSLRAWLCSASLAYISHHLIPLNGNLLIVLILILIDVVSLS